MISIIFATDRKWTIGKDNKLPWRLPADLAYFKKLTIGKTVIMGRKTFESIGKPLPGRENIIITSNKDYNEDGCITCNSIECALDLCKNKDAFIIGGAVVYKEFLQYADRLYVTLIDEEFEGDAYFPEIDFSEWELIDKTEGKYDEKNPYKYSFLVYKRVIT